MKSNSNSTVKNSNVNTVKPKQHKVKEDHNLTVKIEKLKADVIKERKGKEKYKNRCIKLAEDNKTYENKICLLAAKSGRQNVRVNELQAEVNKLNSNVAKLKKSCSKLNSDKVNLKNLAEGRLRTITSLNNRIGELVTDSDLKNKVLLATDELNATIDSLIDRVNKLQTERADLLTELDKLKIRCFGEANKELIEHIDNDTVVAKISAVSGKFKFESGSFYFETFDNKVYTYNYWLPFEFNKGGLFGSVILDAKDNIKRITYISLTAVSFDDYLTELSEKKLLTVNKYNLKSRNVMKAKIKKVFNGQKVLICGSFKVNSIVTHLDRLGLNVKLFDSYGDSANKLNGMISWCDYVINITGSSRHFVNDLILSHEDIYKKRYRKVYKLTCSNAVKILDSILG